MDIYSPYSPKLKVKDRVRRKGVNTSLVVEAFVSDNVKDEIIKTEKAILTMLHFSHENHCSELSPGSSWPTAPNKKVLLKWPFLSETNA